MNTAERIFFPAFLSMTLAVIGLSAQNRIGTGAVRELWEANCASCHGDRGQGGTGGALIDGDWKHGSSDEAIMEAIKNGFPDRGMEAYDETLTDEQIRSLVIFIREQAELAEKESLLERTTPKEGVFRSEEHAFILEHVADGTGILWGMAFLPDGRMLVTQRDGILWMIDDGNATAVEGIPEVWDHGQGGLMDVALHPDYVANGWVYLGYSDSITERGREKGMTTISRGRIEDGKWVDAETIFRAAPEFYLPTRHHFGTRLVFHDGYLFFAVGDRGRRSTAQDLTNPNGKVHRIHHDGRIPDDNPFLGVVDDVFASTWSYGHRNIQGMDVDPRTGMIWAVEHGPRGGDELNRIRPGVNYGWPKITYGMNYNGTPITERTRGPGLAQPNLYWTPSIAICGAAFYTGEQFPKWKNNYFVTGMASEELHRVVIDGDTVLHDEIVMKQQGRVRDVATGPDGNLYVLLVSGSPRVGGVYRLVPAGLEVAAD